MMKRNIKIIGLVIVLFLIFVIYYFYSDKINMPDNREAVCGNSICDNENEITSCAQDCPCIPEGGIPGIDTRNCCNGLIFIPSSCNPEKEICPLGSRGYCTSKCGNGICENDLKNTYFESNYNCPEDCS